MTAPAAESRPHPNLVVSDAGPVRLLRVERPEALGALSGGLVDALLAQVRDVAGSSTIRCLVLTGTGRSFVAGADVAVYRDASAAEFAGYQRRSRGLFDAVADLPQVTVAAVNGFALGGGFELALACDIILAARGAKLGLPEVKLGLIPGGGGTQRLTRLVGAMRAKELVFSGRLMTAEEAYAMGAVLELSDPADLVGRAMELGASFAARAPLAVRAAKRVIDAGRDGALASALSFEQAALCGLFATADGREGVAAFLDKRSPVFTGA